jgi:hypothetical protein
MPPASGEGLTTPLSSLPRFDSSIGRGDFVTQIGVGMLIKGESNGNSRICVENG